MAVRIRLRRVGRKKQPSYRIVVADSAAPRDGNYLDAVGFYNPRTNPAELRLDLEKADEWIGKGALPTDTVASLIRKARVGGDATVGYYGADGVEMPEGSRKTRVTPPKAQKKKAAAATAEPETAEPETAKEPEATTEEAPEAEAKVPEAATEEAPAAEAEEEAAEPEAADEPAPEAQAATEAEAPEAEAAADEAPEVEAPEAEASEDAPEAEAEEESEKEG